MTKPIKIKTDICVVGGGAAGLYFAAGAAQLGVQVLLVERDLMGGDCLNYGCIPSKSLIAIANNRFNSSISRTFDLHNTPADVPSFSDISQNIQNTISTLAQHDSPERFSALGVRIIKAVGNFVSPKCLRAGDNLIFANRFVIATGSHPLIPKIPGLHHVNFLTNETIFYHKHNIHSLAIIGGGPIGIEIAQAMQRLNVHVTIFETQSILTQHDTDAVHVIRKQLLHENISLHENTPVREITLDNSNTLQPISVVSDKLSVQVSHILVSTGRRPNITNLELHKANVNTSNDVIIVNKRLQTSNKKIFALGDVCSQHRYTHNASAQASLLIKYLLFRLPINVYSHVIPNVTFSNPQIAHVGLSLQQAQEKFQPHKIKVLVSYFSDLDRSHCDKLTSGFVKVVASNKGHVLGVTIVGHEAGELISLWMLAINKKIKLSAIASLIIPYPTFSEINKKVAASFYSKLLFSDKTKNIVRLLRKLPF